METSEESDIFDEGMPSRRSTNTQLTISLLGYNNRYPSTSSQSVPDFAMELNQLGGETDDWPTHCAFFEKDVDLEIIQLLAARIQDKETFGSSPAPPNTQNKPTPLYKKFLDIISDSSKNPAEVDSSEVLINMDMLDKDWTEIGDPSLATAVGKQLGRTNKRQVMKGHPRIHRTVKGEEEISGDWVSSSEKTGFISNGDVCIEMLPLTDYVMEESMPHRSHNSFLTSIRKQFNILFSRGEKRRFEREFYV